MNALIERDWITAAGLRAVCVTTTMGHRCGYVEIPEGHWLHGIGYDQETGVPMAALAQEEIGKRGATDLVLMGSRGTAQGGDFFNVHGSVTFSGDREYLGLPGFWYGFDCAHWDDSDDPKDQAFVVAECESLAEQIVVKWRERPVVPAPSRAERQGP